MTCIVGVVDGKNVVLGGDRAATDGGLNRTIIKNPKVFVKSNVGVGVCGLPKVMDAVQHSIEFPVQTGTDSKGFLVSELIPALREGLKKFDCTIDDRMFGTCFHGAMLIAYRGALYELEGNFQLVESSTGFASVGSGAEPAKGSLRSTRGMSGRKRVLEALRVSAENNAGVAPPFDVVVVKR